MWYLSENHCEVMFEETVFFYQYNLYYTCLFSLSGRSQDCLKTGLFVDMVLFSLYMCYCPIYMFTLKYINLTRYTANIWSYLTGFNKARIGET